MRVVTARPLSELSAVAPRALPTGAGAGYHGGRTPHRAAARRGPWGWRRSQESLHFDPRCLDLALPVLGSGPAERDALRGAQVDR